MANRYLIYGLSGSGKSETGKALRGQGYSVIDADFAPGLSSWVNLHTGEKVKHDPPFSEEWLADHEWRWSEARLKEILDSRHFEVLFLVGGAHNLENFLDLFDRRFALYVSNETMRRRLQGREPQRWYDGSPELARSLKWNESFYDDNANGDAILIDGEPPAEVIAKNIIDELGHG